MRRMPLAAMLAAFLSLLDETDAPPASFEIPDGFRFAAAPAAAQLAFKSADASQLVGKFILFNWPAAGWCLGE